MADQLGDLTRTHTCGALRADDVGADAVLLGWVHRVRDLGGVLFIDVRDRAGISQVVVREDDGADGRSPSACARSTSSASRGAVQRRSADTVNPKLATGEVEVLAREIRLLNEAKTPPFSDRGRLAGVGGRAPAVPLPRPAPAAAAGQHRAAPPRGDGDPAATSTPTGFWEIETPILDEVDARRRARLPRAEPRAPGRVLRAAAVAAALQADPDDRRHRSLLPDRPLLPRRGPARRPPARVHAGRRRDVVRAARDRLRR